MILIAEDDIPTNALFQAFLRSGFRGKIISTYNGLEAVEKCLKYHPNLVFMDINMPVKDGITAIRDLRSQGFNNPIVVVSAYGDQERMKAYAVGANSVTTKPIDRVRFLGKIEEFLGPAKISV